MSIIDKWSNKKKGLTEDTVDGESAVGMGSDIRYQKQASTKPALVMMNDGVNICARACASCWDTAIPDASNYLERAKYIGRRTKIGHTSVIEHSNDVFYMYVPAEYTNDLLAVLSNIRYLHTSVKMGINLSGWHVIIGGSWRGYADLFMMTESIHDNFVMLAITNFVYENIPSDGLRDIIDRGILDEGMFVNTELGVREMVDARFNAVSNHRVDDNINIISCDSFDKLVANVNEACAEPNIFTYKDLLEFATVTIEFNGMSRIITQQLTRHRNAITQESQRYVDYSGAPFNSPALFKPERYNPKKLYEISFGGQKFRMNLQNLGDAMNKIYPQLRDKTKFGSDALIPEDARAYLVNNTQCGKIYITFTYYNLIKFLQLREDSHAQAEIRGFATRIGKWFREEIINGMFSLESDEGLYTALNPYIGDKSIFSYFINKGDDDGAANIPVYEEEISDAEYEEIYKASIEKSDSESEE